MKECKYCKNKLIESSFENKIGIFCSEDHFIRYLNSLSDEEYINLQNKFCVCSDD
ncbi:MULTISPECIES: hypothetical protein [unclassified Clostridium]|uniref:hypothetical protein n=1 Tax=unclassified Clostridium TaxID=2614128 RepID=UPI001899AABC|nr:MULTISPECIES: hypothetical protein [unclassified Clostridium]